MSIRLINGEFGMTVSINASPAYLLDLHFDTLFLFFTHFFVFRLLETIINTELAINVYTFIWYVVRQARNSLNFDLTM